MIINRKLLFETEYNEFTSNNKPKSNNVAEWIMQLYELEFKLNIIDHYSEYFDKEDNITNVSLEELKKILENNVKVIGTYLLSILYELSQSWLNYHDTEKLFPNLLSVGNRKKVYNNGQKMIPEYIQLLGIEDWLLDYPKINISGSTEQLNTPRIDMRFLYKFLDIFFDKQYTNEYLSPIHIIDKYIQGTKTNLDPNLYEFRENCFEISKSYFDTYELDFGLTNKMLQRIDTYYYTLREYLEPIRDIYLKIKQINRDDQNKYKLEIEKNVYKVLSNKQKEFHTWLQDSFDNITNELLTKMKKLITKLYTILSNIKNMSQKQILTEQNVVINFVHHTSSFQNNLEDIHIGFWMQSDVYKYYPYDVRNIIPKDIISYMYMPNDLIFSGIEQLNTSLSHIQTFFTDKEKARQYIENTFFRIKQKDGKTTYISPYNPKNFLTILSNLPKPELRIWQQELMKFGLDKHIHLLMGI